jgi:hypothetical protein
MDTEVFAIFSVTRGPTAPGYFSTKMQNYEALLERHGARFQGKISGPKQTLILFSCPVSGSTLALPESTFSSDAIVRRLAESRRDFEQR